MEFRTLFWRKIKGNEGTFDLFWQKVFFSIATQEILFAELNEIDKNPKLFTLN